MTLATSSKASALRLLEKYGQTVTGSSVANDYVPSTGAVTNVVTTSYTGVGYPTQYKSSDIDGIIIRATDTLLLFASEAGVPQVNDILTIGGVSMTALDVQKITVNTTSVMYKIQVRQ